ncbi:MAG: phosphatidylglycerophosphatase A [Planctomycetaceae bacterium]
MPPTDSDARNTRISERVIVFLATGFGVGWIPLAPGTWGSLVGLLLVAAGDAFISQPELKFIAAGLLLILGVPICDKGAKLIGRKDPGEVVWDELAAMPIVFFAIPFHLKTAVIGWAWFRLFDIWKPWPIRNSQHWPGGWGIMIDDVLAAIFAAACLYATVHFGKIMP